MKLCDMLGNEFNIGDKVIYAYNFGNTPLLSIRFVHDIKDGKIYLNNKGKPIQCPERLLNLTAMIKEENDEEI